MALKMHTICIESEERVDLYLYISRPSLTHLVCNLRSSFTYGKLFGNEVVPFHEFSVQLQISVT